MVADHLSRLVVQEADEHIPIPDFFPDEHLFSIHLCVLGMLTYVIILQQDKYHRIGAQRIEEDSWRM